MFTREAIGEKRGCPNVHRHMGIKLAWIELAESIPGEARGIVYEQPHRRLALRRGEDRIGTTHVGQVSDHFDRTRRRLVVVVMDMSND
jgi:hypothetical protein